MLSTEKRSTFEVGSKIVQMRIDNILGRFALTVNGEIVTQSDDLDALENIYYALKYALRS
jgi:hypothetical protein